MTQWFDAFQRCYGTVTQAIIDRIRRSIPSYSGVPNDELRRRVEAGLLPYSRDLDEPEPHHFADYWGTIAYQRAQAHVPLTDFLEILLLSSQETLHGLSTLYADDPAQHLAILDKGYAVTATGIAAVYAGYGRHKDEIIAAQTRTLDEVSSPIMPIYEGVLVLPLVGSIDSRRASQIMEDLLQGINDASADVVIIDITGVPVIDTAVTNYLLQAARAARLLGSTVILVGVSAEIAQTMVQLGISLESIITRANLQSGIEHALAMQGLAIGPAPQEPGRAAVRPGV